MEYSNTENNVCSHKHSFALDNILRKILQNPKKITGPYLQEGYTAIDLGCGPGFFTTAMAEMVGPSGKVLAVDLQHEMLDELAAKVFDSKLAKTVDLHKCEPDVLNLPDIEADFILAYYMVHEVPSPVKLFSEIKKNLKDEGKVLIVEPYFHVSKAKFTELSQTVEKVGFKIVEQPKGKGGRSLLLSLS